MIHRNRSNLARFVNFLTAALLVVGATSAFGLKLTLWEHEKDEDQKFLDELISDFTSKNKGITINRSHYKTEDLRTQFQTAAMGGGGADVVIAPNDFAGPFSIMQIIKQTDGLYDKSKFFPNVVQAVSDSAGRSWGIPLSNGNHLMLFANKKLVPKTPDTIEELVVAARKVTNAEKSTYGLVYNLNEPFWFVPFAGAYGGQPLVKGQPQLGDDAFVKAFALVKKLKFEDKIVPPDCDYACAETLFLDSKAGMIINGDWAVGKYQKALGDDLLISPLPKLKETGKWMTPFVSGKYLFMNAKLRGKKLAAAKKFAEFLTSGAVQEAWVKKTGRLPALIATAKGDAVAKNAAVAASLKAAENGVAMPMDVEMRAVWDAIRPELQKVMSGRQKPDLAAAAMQKDVINKIKEMKQ